MVFKRIKEWIKEKFKSEIPVEVEVLKNVKNNCNVKYTCIEYTQPDETKCAKCGKKLKLYYYFKCHYCYKNFCEAHRLPEEHNCEGNLITPHEMKLGASKSTRF